MDLEIVDKFLHHSNQDVKISEIFGGVSCEESSRFFGQQHKILTGQPSPPNVPPQQKKLGLLYPLWFPVIRPY